MSFFESYVVVLLIFACRVEIPFNWKTYFSTLFDVINIFVTFALLVVGTLITRIPCIFRAENETNLLPTMSLSKVTFEYRPWNQTCKKSWKIVKSIAWKAFFVNFLHSFLFFFSIFFSYFFFLLFFLRNILSLESYWKKGPLTWRISFGVFNSSQLAPTISSFVSANEIPRYLTKLIWKSCCALLEGKKWTLTIIPDILGPC